MKARCVRQRCTRRPVVSNLCRVHAVDQCDRWCRALVMADNNRCTACGSTENGQWSHHMSRRYMAIRWMYPGNSTRHCAPCHTRFTHDRDLHIAEIKRLEGEDAYEMLYIITHQDTDARFTVADLTEEFERLRKENA